MLENFDLFENIVQTAAKNPIMNAAPVIKVNIDCDFAKLSWILIGTKGIWGPKYRTKNTIPAKSISNNKIGIYIYVAMAGIVNVVITKIRHRAATKATDNTIGINASIIE